MIRLLLKLPNSTFLDQTNLDNYLLQLAAHLIAPCLTYIFNLSLNSSCVPDSGKSASITPIYKGKGDRSECGNYRPISIIPTVIKIIEYHVKENLVSFLAHHHLLSPSQYAYTKGISTEMALHTLVDDTFVNMDKGKVTVACMLDLTKGFDRVCHEILLHKLHFYGIKGLSLQWFKSYLLNCTQFVKFNNSYSTKQHISIGVPQGLILGPILFLLNVNDFPQSFKNCKCIIYADYTSSNNPTLLKNTIQNALSEASDWLGKNLLVVNTSKSNFITLVNPSRVDNLRLSLQLSDEYLPFSNSSKLLGVVIDSSLSLKDHVNSLLKKLGLLHRLSFTLPQNVLVSLYLSIIQPHIAYCLSVWGSCNKTTMNSIQKIQNRAARIVTKCIDFNIRSIDLIRQLKWMTFEERCIYFT